MAIVTYTFAGSSVGRTPDFESGGRRFKPCPASFECATDKFLSEVVTNRLAGPIDSCLPDAVRVGDFSSPTLTGFLSDVESIVLP